MKNILQILFNKIRLYRENERKEKEAIKLYHLHLEKIKDSTNNKYNIYG